MLAGWFSQFRNSSTRPRLPRRFVEPLESRQLLSGAIDPLAIDLLGTWNSPADAIAISTSHAYIGRGTDFSILDRTAPATPVSTLTLTGAIRDIALVDDLACVAAGDAGLHIVEVTDPASPRLLATYDTAGHASGVSIANGRVYVADADGGVLVLGLVDNRVPLPNFNDDFADRLIITGTSASITATNSGASTEPGEPWHAGNSGGSSVWWTWTAPSAGQATVATAGSGFDTVLGVYTGDAVNALTLVGQNDDFGGQVTSRVTFTAVAGVSYHIAVDGFDGDQGSVSLQLNFVAAAAPEAGPDNDNFADRAVITGSSATVFGSNFGATGETGEPAHAGSYGLASVWWTWTAPSAGTVTMDLGDSTFDTLMAVYTGDSLDGLTVVAENDDFAYPTIRTSRVSFDVLPGTTYQIAVDGFEGDTGMVVLSLELAATTELITFQLLHEWDIPADAIAVWDGRASIADGVSLGVYDITSPDQPTLLAAMDLSANVADIAMAGSLAIVSLGEEGMQIIDLADPLYALQLSSYVTAGQPGGIDFIGNDLFLADGAEGVALLRIDPEAGLVASREMDQPIGSSRSLLALEVIDTASVSLAPGGAILLDVASIWIGGDGLLDLADNAMIVRGAPETRHAVLARITEWMRSPVGIISSTAGDLTAIIAVLNDRGDGTPIHTTFGGAPVGVDDVLVMFTYIGDVNVDGEVNAADYFQLDRSFLDQPATVLSQHGDLDANGVIDGDDFFRMDSSFLGQTGRLGTGLTQPISGEAAPADDGRLVRLFASAQPIAIAASATPAASAASSMPIASAPTETSVWEDSDDALIFQMD